MNPQHQAGFDFVIKGQSRRTGYSIHYE